jgi:hypothetical protein
MFKFIKRLTAKFRIPKGLYCHKCPYYWYMPESPTHWHWCNYQNKCLDDVMPYRNCEINVSADSEGGTC